jgi:hypothetical protein
LKKLKKEINNMFGLIGDILDGTAKLVGTVAGIAIAPIAIALGVSERMV